MIAVFANAAHWFREGYHVAILLGFTGAVAVGFGVVFFILAKAAEAASSGELKFPERPPTSPTAVDPTSSATATASPTPTPPSSVAETSAGPLASPTQDVKPGVVIDSAGILPSDDPTTRMKKVQLFLRRQGEQREAEQARRARYVQPNTKRGGWDVAREGPDGGERISAHTNTKAEAIKRARQIVLHEGGGEIRIKDEQGRVIKTIRPRRKSPNRSNPR